MDQPFRLADEVDQVIFINISGEEQVDHGAIEAIGQLADEVDLSDFSKAFDYGIDDGVKADVLDEDIMDLLKERMIRIGLKIFLVALRICPEHPCLFEAVEFLPDSVGGVAKFRLESAEIGARTAVEEELQQEFDPRPGRDEGFDHSVSNMIE